MNATVAIPTFRRPRDLEQTLEDLAAQSLRPAQVLVIDQGGPRDPADEARTHCACRDMGASRYVVDWSHLPRARNLALERTTGDIVVFVDDDVRLPVDFLAAHRRCYERPEVQAVAGRVRDAQKSEHAAALAADGLPPSIDDLPETARDPAIGWFHHDLVHTRKAQWVLTARGCNMSFRTAFVRAHDLWFDERFRGGAVREDSDFCLQIRAAGAGIWYEPAAELTHLNTPSGGIRAEGRESLARKIAFFHNHLLMARKHLRGGDRRRFELAFTRCHVIGLPPCNKTRKPWVVAARALIYLIASVDARWSVARRPSHPRLET